MSSSPKRMRLLLLLLLLVAVVVLASEVEGVPISTREAVVVEAVTTAVLALWKKALLGRLLMSVAAVLVIF